MKQLFLAIFIVICCLSYSQELVFTSQVEFGEKQYAKTRVFPISNKETGKLSLLFLNEDKIQSLLLTDELELKVKQQFYKKKDKNFLMVGSTINDETYHLFFVEDNQETFFIKSINPLTEEARKRVFKMPIGDVLQAFVLNNKFLCLNP